MFDTIEHAVVREPTASIAKNQDFWSRTATPRLFSSPVTDPQPFRARAYFRCLALGHDMVLSRSHPGRITCRRCRMRRTY